MNLSEFMVKLSSQSGAQELAQMIKGRAVLLGFSSKSAGDISVSPFGGEWPGVFVHLNQIENFLSSQSFEVKVGKNIISLLFGFVVLVLCAYSSAVIGTSLFAVLMFFVFSYHQNNLIMDRYYQDAFSFLFFGNLAFFSQMILNFYFKEKSNRFISKAFSSYVDPKLLKHILKAENTIKLGGKKQVVTVLFSDIRNFTTNSEVLEPEEVIELLNEWFTLIEPHISRHKGVIRHYIGDAVMVLYNFPIEDPFQSFNALKSADLILGEAAFFEQKVAEKIGYREGLQPFKVGVAIHTGGVVVGNIGSEKRMEFSAVGDAVNTATRIEGETKHLNNPLAISHEALCQMCFGDYNLKNKTEEEIRTIAKSLKINLGKRVETNVKGRKKVVVFYEFLGFGNI